MFRQPLILTAILFGSVAHAQQTGPLFTFQEVMIPVRDGVHLQTVIMAPANQTGPLPILFRRTPYGVPSLAPSKKAAKSKHQTRQSNTCDWTGDRGWRRTPCAWGIRYNRQSPTFAAGASFHRRTGKISAPHENA